MEPSPIDHDLEPSAEARPRYRRNLRSRYEAPTLAPRAKQAPRRTQVRWYPIHGYQHDQPSQLQAPSLPVARAPTMRHAANGTRAIRAASWPLDSGSHINAGGEQPRRADASQRAARLPSYPTFLAGPAQTPAAKH